MTPIIRLLFTCSPAAISGLVVAIGIWVAVKAGIRRARTHVAKEVFKMLPAVTNFNASSAISLPRMIARIPAAVACLRPAFIFARLLHSMRSVMAWLSLTRCGMCSQCFFCKATATSDGSMPRSSGFTAAQISALDNGFGPTITKTIPFRLLRNNWQMSFQHYQSPYALSC